MLPYMSVQTHKLFLSELTLPHGRNLHLPGVKFGTGSLQKYEEYSIWSISLSVRFFQVPP